jgi:hypothetical protein
VKSNVAVGRGIYRRAVGRRVDRIQTMGLQRCNKVFILESDLPVINSYLQLCYASITNVLALLVSSKLMTIVQLILDENQRIIAHGFHWFI